MKSPECSKSHTFTVYPKNIFVKSLPLEFYIFRIYNSGMKQKRGRPLKKPGEAKSESLLLRLEPREKEAFLLASSIAGIPLTVWIRERLRRVVTNELEQAGKKNPILISASKD